MEANQESEAIARIDAFNLKPGRVLAGKYEVLERLGKGWEGEVYLVSEVATGIERAVKIFYPHRDVNQRSSIRYAKKLHKLRHCQILIQYHGMDMMRFKGHDVPLMVSDFVEGELLSKFINRHPGKRLAPFQALHMLHALCKGIESIHRAGEYHGDLHTDNVIVQRYGLGFELKLLDLFHWDAKKGEARQDDLLGLIEIFYEALGGRRHYAKQPQVVKSIIRGKRSSLIFQRFKRVAHLRAYLETLEWV